MKQGNIGDVCIVAIVRDELPFIEEWLAYHRILGIRHFCLYDDSEDLPLSSKLFAHRNYITVIPWHNVSDHIVGRNRQTKAYWHAFKHFGSAYRWIGFLDIDEFLVIKCVSGIKEFLEGFDEFDAVSLNWHVFGHCGHYDDPLGLVTYNLIRRKREPSIHGKTFTKVSSIKAIDSAHSCVLKSGSIRVDAKKRDFSNDLYPGRTSDAHINHYQCRSFRRWMLRVARGDVNVDSTTAEGLGQAWRVDEAQCLRKFVETVALDKNEYIDDYMRKYRPSIEMHISRLASVSNLGINEPTG